MLIVCCNKKYNKIISTEDKNIKQYIISHEEKELKKYADSMGNRGKPLPFNSYYGESNLIIDRRNNLYFYQKNAMAAGCGTGMENDTIPEFLNLQPKDLIKIPKESIELIISENVLTKKENRQILIIASQDDTIKDQKILNFLYNLKVPIYEIRRTTQEEDTVLHYKTTNQFYYSDQIKWDKKKIKLKN